tara:strand:- start:214 stop:1989 length:1776 start_codon:yes stop_codon:yes gene_type:complete
MKILRLLNNKKIITLFFIFLLNSISIAEDKPIDIWNIDKKKVEENQSSEKNTIEAIDNNKKLFESDIYKMQSEKKNSEIKLDQDLSSRKLKIFGLYDPDDYSLDINMWVNSDGDQLRNLFTKLNKIELSNDAAELVELTILTNAYYPNKNINEKEFLKLKSDWIIKNSDLDMIEEYLTKNQIININPELFEHFVNENLSDYNIDKACEIFSKNSEPINNEYLSKFNIYCLVKTGKKDQAQIIYDLKKELGFNDKYFEKKINFLLDFKKEVDEEISEKNILDFHLAREANPNFVFEPENSTKKIIWKYLSSSNLLTSFKEIDISELKKISTIETAVHNKNYPEKDLLELYKRFQFDINQLLDAKNSLNSLTNIESRALIYQKILLESEMVEKLKLLKILKDLFRKDKIENAFDLELKKFLKKMNPVEIPDNLTSFYYTNIKIEKDKDKKIKFNNDILHQSKLINYFNGDYSKNKIEKDINNYLKKITKNKKYFLSKKDIIFLESLKSDGVEIDKKYNNLYEIEPSEIPTDIQVMINNNEKGAALIRLAEVIGQDELDRIDEDTIYFIISTLNQLNIDVIRNKILLKVLPLKV